MRSQLLSQPARAIGASLLRGQTDERLVDLSRAGHQDAYAAIVRRHRPALLRYCTSIVGPHRAQDAVQQAFIDAHTAMLRDRRDIHLKPWLYRIAHNASLGLMRGAPALIVVPDELADSAAKGPEELTELRDRLKRTMAAIEQLPDSQRDAILLQAFEGASHEQVALALGVTEGAARQQLHRARSTLRAAVTSLTPIPLLSKLLVATGGSASAAGWAELATGTGLSAATLKIGAGLAATAAIAGGGVESGVIDTSSLRAGTATVQQAAPSTTPPRTANPAVTGDDRRHGSGWQADEGRGKSSRDAADRRHGREQDRPGAGDGPNADTDDGHVGNEGSRSDGPRGPANDSPAKRAKDRSAKERKGRKHSPTKQGDGRTTATTPVVTADSGDGSDSSGSGRRPEAD